MIEWISTNNALPCNRTNACLVWFEDTSVPYLGWYNSNLEVWITRRKGYDRTNKVTYWTFLNNPYEGV